MPKPPIRGVLFDKDGTLFDFTATWRGLTERILGFLAPDDRDLQRRLGAAVGFDLGQGVFAPGSLIVAGATGQVAAVWAGLIPGGDAATLEQMANRMSGTIEGPMLTPAAPDLPGLLDGLRAAGMALGVATHDAEAAARRHLAAVDALDRFDFVAGYDSGWGLKPAPDMVLAFARAAGLDPRAVAMVGDSLHDLGAARAAGAAAVAVLTGPATAADLAPHADVVLASIADLPGWLAGRDGWPGNDARASLRA